MAAYIPLMNEKDIAELTAMGFCNMGEGAIARISSRPDKRTLAYRLRNIGAAQTLWDGSPANMVEDLWRTFCETSIVVGIDYAEKFPASTTTVTKYIILSAAEQKVIATLREAIEEGNSDDGRTAREQAEARAKDYTADALF